MDSHFQFRRQLLGRLAAFAAAPALLLPLKTHAQDSRPDQIDPEFWLRQRRIRLQRPATSAQLEITYWDGAYIEAAYSELCFFLLDRRDQVAVQMVPAVFDLTYATQRWFEAATSKRATTVITDAFRTEQSNRIVGGAPLSSHLTGAALDGALEGVPLSVYASMLQRFGAGGVGLYPRHVHWDIRSRPAFWRSNYAE
jgi:uncharacterized protein YcbK (DUF882 family)